MVSRTLRDTAKGEWYVLPVEPTPEPPPVDELLTPSEVAALFRVNPKTVTRWARSGKISAIRTLGGHRRFRAAEIRRLLEQEDASGDPHPLG